MFFSDLPEKAQETHGHCSALYLGRCLLGLELAGGGDLVQGHSPCTPPGHPVLKVLLRNLRLALRVQPHPSTSHDMRTPGLLSHDVLNPWIAKGRSSVAARWQPQRPQLDPAALKSHIAVGTPLHPCSRGLCSDCRVIPQWGPLATGVRATEAHPAWGPSTGPGQFTLCVCFSAHPPQFDLL